MPNLLERRRVLIAGRRPQRDALQALFDAGLFPAWDAVAADGVERARFVLQMEPCDVLVLDADLYRRRSRTPWSGWADPTGRRCCSSPT